MWSIKSVFFWNSLRFSWWPRIRFFFFWLVCSYLSLLVLHLRLDSSGHTRARAIRLAYYVVVCWGWQFGASKFFLSREELWYEFEDGLKKYLYSSQGRRKPRRNIITRRQNTIIYCLIGARSCAWLSLILIIKSSNVCTPCCIEYTV